MDTNSHEWRSRHPRSGVPPPIRVRSCPFVVSQSPNRRRHGWTRMHTDEDPDGEGFSSVSVSLRVHPWSKIEPRMDTNLHEADRAAGGGRAGSLSAPIVSIRGFLRSLRGLRVTSWDRDVGGVPSRRVRCSTAHQMRAPQRRHALGGSDAPQKDPAAEGRRVSPFLNVCVLPFGATEGNGAAGPRRAGHAKKQHCNLSLNSQGAASSFCSEIARITQALGRGANWRFCPALWFLCPCSVAAMSARCGPYVRAPWPLCPCSVASVSQPVSIGA